MLQILVRPRMYADGGNGEGPKMKVADDGRSVSVQVEVWFEQDGSIRLAMPGFSPPFVVIKNDAERPSGHPKLFGCLARHLNDQGIPTPELAL